VGISTAGPIMKSNFSLLIQPSASAHITSNVRGPGCIYLGLATNTPLHKEFTGGEEQKQRTFSVRERRMGILMTP
jgi:hypothetical protein